MLVYLYFFVFYTATVEINSNVDGYDIQLFSLSTATKISQTCRGNPCILRDVSPFEYNLRISKPGYESQSEQIKIEPRKRQSFVFQLEKKASLKAIEKTEKNTQELINAKRNKNKFYSYFEGQDGIKIFFKEFDDMSVEIIFSQDTNEYSLWKFPKVPKKEIFLSQISPDAPMLLQMWKDSYIFLPQKRTLKRLPLEIAVKYIKNTHLATQYDIVTEKGIFRYTPTNSKLEYQYIFKDFVQDGKDFIGIVYSDEREKKENFSLSQSGNLIVRYNLKTKERKVLLATTQKIDAIFWQGEDIIIESWNSQMYLRNYK